MNSILYIGNKLSHHGYTKGVIETLGLLLQSEGFKVHYAGENLNPFFRLLEMLYNIWKLRNKVSYLLIDTYSTSAFWYAYLAGITARLMKIKYIPILHGGNMPVRLQKSKCACNLLFTNSYSNVAVSGYLKKAFDEVGYKAIVIPNNIDISLYPVKIRSNPKPKILWVRSFHQQYNPNMAIDVLEELLKMYPDAVLCMVGPDKDGSMKDFKDYAQNKGILDKIKITGILSKETWLELSSDYDFFINTTNVDNTPVSVIEAMALGLCVISTNPGGIPFILSHNKNACLVNPGDAQKMAGCIASLLDNNSDFHRITSNGRKIAEGHDWGIIKNHWIKLLA